MKGIIAEIHSSYMIVIAKNGDFVKCKKLPNCNVGDEIVIPAGNMNSIYKRISTIAASFLILIMLSSGVYAYYTPYSYVSVDINPSLELYVNRFDKVIGVHAFNAEAQKVIEVSEGVKNRNIDAALEEILDSAAETGYLKKNTENSVMIVVSSNNKKEETALADKISKTSTAVLSSMSSEYEVILEKTQVENYKKAKEQNISPGKVILANRFKEVKPEINEEEIKHMPLQQAIKQIEKKDEKKNQPEKAEKPTAITSEKPKPKAEPKNNVMNIKELIKEKNEELGNKLEQEKADKKEETQDKDKNNGKEDKEKKEKDSEDESKGKEKDKESFNQAPKEDSKDKAASPQEKGGQDNKQSKDDDKKDKNKD